MAAVAPTNPPPRKERAVAEDEDDNIEDNVQAIVDLTNPDSMDAAARKMALQLRDALRTVESTDAASDEHDVEQEPEGVDESGPDLPELPVAPLTDQFPAVDGTEAGLHAEVAQRSADGSDGDVHYKVVSVSGVGITDDHPMHRANAGGVLQEAIQRGLHPRGDVYFVDKVEHDEPLNASGTRRSRYTDLRYAVQVIPASIDTESTLSTLPRDIAEPQP